MYRLYRDIRDKLGEPLWHDEHGVPRYVEFHPQHCGIYDDEVALLEIRCQGCGRLFLVSDSWDHTDWLRTAQAAKEAGQPMPDLRDGSMEKPNATNYGGGFSFGDAPWHTYEDTDGQCSGTTMTTDTVRVVEFWRRAHCEWRRCPEYEFTYPLDESGSANAGATPLEVGATESAQNSSSSSPPDLSALIVKWRNENGDYPESKQDCADELEAALGAITP